MTNKSKTIAEFRTALAEAKARPGIERTALADYADLLESRPAPPITDGAAAHLADRMERAEIKRALTEFDEWHLDARALTAEQNFLQANGPEIVAAFRSEIEARSARLPGALELLGQKLSTLAADAFGNAASREANRVAREKIEGEAADAEAKVATAASALRGFELSPTIEAFEAAAARVNEIRF